jgi:hypothetical protein
MSHTVQRLAQGFAVDGARLAMQQARPIQFAENGDYATGPMHVFHVVFLRGGGDLAQIGTFGATGGRCRAW